MQKIMIIFSLLMTVILSITHFPSAVCFAKLFGLITCAASVYDTVSQKSKQKSSSQDVCYKTEEALLAK